MQGSKVWALEGLCDELSGWAWNKLDNTVRKTRLFKNFHKEVVAVDCHWRGLPDADVAHEDRGRHEVSTNCGEVERRYGEDKALKGSVLGSVPDCGRVFGRLRGVELLGVEAVEAPKVNELAGRINFCLPWVLALYISVVRNCSSTKEFKY